MKPQSPAHADVQSYHWIVLPNTGVQICRGFPIARSVRDDAEKLFDAAHRQASRQPDPTEALRLIDEHIACNREIDATPWLQADPNEFVFHRLRRAGGELQLDLVIDTCNGAGSQAGNRVPLRVGEPSRFSLRRSEPLAEVYVEHHRNARNEIGTLIVDFGNTGSAFVFSRDGAGPLQARVVEANNPFDPDYRARDRSEAHVLRSNMIVLRVSPNEHETPWIVLGERAEELIRRHPLTSYLYAPKKYVRDWPDIQRAPEPTMKFRGIAGQRVGLHPMLTFVRTTLDQMFQRVLASLTNPQFTSDAPELYPQIRRVMLTYPLTWREVDRRLFADMVNDTALRLFAHDDEHREQFEVELICSEPVAVAAYVLWETIFQFESQNLMLAASSLGNVAGTPELRMLVLDIGGGSTDIACVDIGWTVEPADGSVDVSFRMIESMRFNRAGDRISHLIATVIVAFLESKHGIDEPLDFLHESREPAFTLTQKRLAVSTISRLAEECKRAIAGPARSWTLAPHDETELVACFAPLLDGDVWRERVGRGPELTIDEAALRTWLTRDTQTASPETNGEPGFQDVFVYLAELRRSLAEKGREPHCVILSGRTTRLGFLRELAAKSLKLPVHRVRTLGDILPRSAQRHGERNLDKLAVVFGAQRFRFGDHIRFQALPGEAIFNRFIGTVRESRTGLRLNQIMIRPGDGTPKTISVRIEPARDVRIGHAFREKGSAQVIANLSNRSHTEAFDIELDVLDDYSVRMPPHPQVVLTEWVPGGNDFVVDNFNDTGQIDQEPRGLLRHLTSDRYRD
ncbi:MAG: hypothetical protein IPM29_03660 [Planctomycetes bacterium]|nr:hypothetical protein [Planctomycetota bacterium]